MCKHSHCQPMRSSAQTQRKFTLFTITQVMKTVDRNKPGPSLPTGSECPPAPERRRGNMFGALQVSQNNMQRNRVCIK